MKKNLLMTDIKRRMHSPTPAGGRRDWGKRGRRNNAISRGIRASLCGTWLLCCLAYASDQQVIVKGGQRLTGIVRTSGHDVPLLSAVEEILPTSYSVNAPNAGAWADIPVNWHAGDTVTHALGAILSVDASLHARIDTELRLVTVTADARPTAPSTTTSVNAPAGTGRPSPPLLVATAPAASSPSAAPHTATQLLPAAEATPAGALPPAPERAQWQMRDTDGSVRNALARWASEAGWQFVWDVPTDFEVDATATIHGSLEEALRQVTNALAGSNVPIQVVLYKRNRVMRVVSKGAN
jgi:hypothetical protein